MSKDFETAARAATTTQEEEEAGLPFTVTEKDENGNVTARVTCRCFRPGDGQLAILMATTGRHSSQNEQIAGIINFFASVLDDDSHTYLVNRLLDRKDEFGLEQVQDIMEWMIEEWTGRPTKSPSVSTRSPSSTGQGSTPPTPALT